MGHSFIRTLVAPAVAACGGGEILAIVSFIGSAGGDWRFDDAAAAGFQQRSNCGELRNELCFINIQRLEPRNDYATDFAVSYTGNLVAGCPSGEPQDEAREDGIVRGKRIVLPGCFSGQYVTINEVVSDNGDRAFFDSELPDLTGGVWVEIQDGIRRFKFSTDNQGALAGCELTLPTRTPVTAITIVPADLDSGRLQTEITDFTVGGTTWSGRFEGMSGMRLTRGSEVLELQRRDLPDAC
jgi:hypothetical protein